MVADADGVVREHVSRLLADWASGDFAARERLVPIVYEELRRLAHHYMRAERDGHTLQTTALVNEMYLRQEASNRLRRRRPGGVRRERRAHTHGVRTNHCEHR